MGFIQTIALVLPDLRSGGAERVNVELANIFQKRGFEVEFVLRRAKGELLEQAGKIGRIVDLNAPRVRNAIAPLEEYLQARRPEAVLAAMWPLTAVAARARALSGHSCSLVLCEHGILSKQYADWGTIHSAVLRASLRYATRRADYIVGVSEGVVQDLSLLTGCRSSGFQVIYNPVPVGIEVTEAQAIRADSIWTAPKGRRVLTVGRLKQVKNHRMLIDAFAMLLDKDTELMIVGDGDLRADLVRHAAFLGVGHRVIFAGFQSDPTPFYRSADLFVLSSNREAFGNVLVEAMNEGLPIVSTDCPTGPREVLADGKYGYLTSVDNAKELAEAIIKGLSSPVDPAAQRARAKKFRPEIAADAYLELLIGSGR